MLQNIFVQFEIQQTPLHIHSSVQANQYFLHVQRVLQVFLQKHLINS